MDELIKIKKTRKRRRDFKYCVYCSSELRNNLRTYCSRECYANHKRVLIAEGKLKMPEKDFRHRADLIRGKTFEEYYGEEKAKEIRAKCSAGKLGKPHPTKHRWSEEEKERRRREILDDPIRMKKIRETRAKQVFPFYNSSIEILVRGILDTYGIKYLKHKPIMEIEDPYACDIFVPNLNMIIECDGEYFHRIPAKAERDKRRTKEMRQQGYLVLRFWETTIRKHPEYIYQTIEQILNIISPDKNLESAKELLNANFEKYQEEMRHRSRTVKKRYIASHKEQLKEKRRIKTLEIIEYNTVNNIRFICPKCQNEFIPKKDILRYKQKYCSVKCSRIMLSRIGARVCESRIGKRKQERGCSECMKLEKGFCSARCRDNYNYRQRYWRNKTTESKQELIQGVEI